MLAAGLEASKLWIREAINLQRELVRDFIATRPLPSSPTRLRRLPRRRVLTRRSGGKQALSDANKITTKAARAEALDAATKSSPSRSVASSKVAAARSSGHSFADEEAGARANHRRRCSHRRT